MSRLSTLDGSVWPERAMDRVRAAPDATFGALRTLATCVDRTNNGILRPRRGNGSNESASGRNASGVDVHLSSFVRSRGGVLGVTVLSVFAEK